jgi:uncharacterized membrane protein YjdF
MEAQTVTYSYKKPFVIGVLCSFLLMGVNSLAEFFKIYSGYHWFDNPMHFFGGFCAGLLSIGVLRSVFSAERYERTPQFIFTVLGVLCVGVAWELAEAFYKVSVLYGGDFWTDTYKDLLMDTLGGILSYICFHPRIKRLSR